MEDNYKILQLGDCYLIKDTNLKTKKFIGKIITIGHNGVTMIKYIFPEDTKEFDPLMNTMGVFSKSPSR